MSRRDFAGLLWHHGFLLDARGERHLSRNKVKSLLIWDVLGYVLFGLNDFRSLFGSGFERGFFN